MQNIGEKAEEYNKSRAAQVVLIDMSLDDLSISLHSVDLGNMKHDNHLNAFNQHTLHSYYTESSYQK
jgi:hypothetical protein